MRHRCAAIIVLGSLLLTCPSTMGQTTGESENVDLFSGYGHLRWQDHDVDELVFIPPPPVGWVVRTIRPLELRGPNGPVTVPVNTVVRVDDVDGESVLVSRDGGGVRVSGPAAIEDLHYSQKVESIALGERTFTRRGVRIQRLGGMWDERLDWKDIEPEAIQVFGLKETLPTMKTDTELVFCAGKLVQTVRNYSFPAGDRAGHRALVDGLQKRYGPPVCRVKNKLSVVCTWENEDGVVVVPIAGRLADPKPAPRVEAPLRKAELKTSAWSVYEVRDLGSRLRSREGDNITSDGGTFILVGFSVLNKKRRAVQPGIARPLITDDAGRELERYGGHNDHLHMGLVQKYSGRRDAKILHHMGKPLQPGVETRYYAIYEVPHGSRDLALMVADLAPWGRDVPLEKRTRIPIDDLLDPATVGRPANGGTEAARRDVWEVLDREQPITVQGLFAVSTGLPQLKARLSDEWDADLTRAIEESLR